MYFYNNELSLISYDFLKFKDIAFLQRQNIREQG